jgi:hypothetical protein
MWPRHARLSSRCCHATAPARLADAPPPRVHSGPGSSQTAPYLVHTGDYASKPETKSGRFAALFQSPLTDSNRRPPPYHLAATSRNPRQRFWLVRAASAPIRFATDCHRLQPRGSIKAASSVVRIGYVATEASPRSRARSSYGLTSRVVIVRSSFGDGPWTGGRLWGSPVGSPTWFRRQGPVVRRLQPARARSRSPRGRRDGGLGL